MCLLPPALCVLRVWHFSFCHAIAMLPSPYPYPILVMLGGLSSLCGETLHGGTDLLCVVCGMHFVVLSSVPTL